MIDLAPRQTREGAMGANGESTSGTASSAKKLEHYLALGSTLDSSAAAVDLIGAATAEPGLLAFQELLELPGVRALEKSDEAACRAAHGLLLTFAYGTWSTYREQADRLPSVTPAQELKLKQLTLITLAGRNKVIPYATLMSELDLSGVRQLEDFVIEHCIYAGAVSGKLDQRRGCLEVEYAVGRDVHPSEVGEVIGALESWLESSDSLLRDIQAQVDWANQTSQAKKQHERQVTRRVEEVKKNIRAEMELRGGGGAGGSGGQQDAMMTDSQGPGLDMMDEDIRDPRSVRSKRRR